VGAWAVGGDDRCHFVAVIAGEVRFADHWQLPPLRAGECVLLPASIGRQDLATGDAPTTLLHVTLP
jgi:hypothetical protein